MKKYALLIGIALIIAISLKAQPIAIPIKLGTGRTVVKLDSQTCEITTTITNTTVFQRDRAEIQTELDHIPDRKAEIQKQLDAVNEREAELIKILEVFK